VIDAIFKDVITTTAKGGDDAHVVHVAGGEQQRPWSAGECVQFFFQGVVGAWMTV